MKNVYSVSQVNFYIKNMFDQDFMLRGISMRGEVSNCKYHTSGHIYFSLKDDGGVMSCVMFASSRDGLKHEMKNGDNVIVHGSVSVYERDGRYQFYAKKIEPEGQGELYRRFVELKKELEDMGMFDAQYKQPIPKYIKKLGIVTAPAGAAVRDIINVSTRRNPFIQLILCPAQVQGEDASESISRAIFTLDTMTDVDVIIVGRGGGSMEDLQAFNEELTARAIFECRTPVISAVGHETDITISDYVADMRAPTPSAAAELAVFDIREFLDMLQNFRYTLNGHMSGILESYRSRTDLISSRLSGLSPRQSLRDNIQHVTEIYDALVSNMKQILLEKHNQMSVCAEHLYGLSPVEKLRQGYSYTTRSSDNKRILSISDIDIGQEVCVRVFDGNIRAIVREKENFDDR